MLNVYFPTKVDAMKKCLSIVLFVALVSSFAAGCKAKPEAKKTEEKDRVIVTVNGKPITLGDVNFLLRKSHGGELTPEVRKQAVEDAIRLELLYQKGEGLGLDRDAKFRQRIIEMQRTVDYAKRIEMARLIYNTEIASKVNITDEEMKKYFVENASRIRTELHLLQLTFSDSAQAEQAATRVLQGTPFEELARERFPGMKFAKGQRPPWDLGFMGWQQLPLEWHDVAYRLKEGELGIVTGDRMGSRLIKLVELRENPQADFESTRASIANRLRDKKLKEANDSYVESLKGQAKIVKQEGWELVEK